MNKQWLSPHTLTEAAASQKEMATLVCCQNSYPQPIRFIAGMDVSCNPFDLNKIVYAAVVVLSYPALDVQEVASSVEKAAFPYVPGYLGFREAPSLVSAFSKLSIRPDILFVDGHGISHPRGLGIASHMGVLLDIASIGVAKSLLVGKPNAVLDQSVGSFQAVNYKHHEVARLIRTKKQCNPLIVSCGHKVALDSAVDIVQSCVRGYRFPEPIRHAHLVANQIRKAH